MIVILARNFVDARYRMGSERNIIAPVTVRAKSPYQTMRESIESTRSSCDESLRSAAKKWKRISAENAAPMAHTAASTWSTVENVLMFNKKSSNGIRNNDIMVVMGKRSPKKILILGAGFAGIYAFFELHKRYHKDPSVSLRLVSATDYFLFTPLLHEVATGGVSQENVAFNIYSMAPCCLDFTKARVEGIDTRAKTVRTTVGEFEYDYLVYALGSGTNFFGLPAGAQKHVLPLKTLADARAIKARLVGLFKAGEMPHVVVVGGGPTGVEVAAEAHEYLEQLIKTFRLLKAPQSLTLVHGGNRLLPQFSPELGAEAARVLKSRGIEIVANDTVVDVEKYQVVLASGRHLPANAVIWAAGVKAQPAPFSPVVETDAKGRIIVTKSLYLKNDPHVFIVGDAAALNDVPMTAQAAVVMGRAAGDNIARDIERAPMKVFIYKHKGDMFSLGQWFAGAEIGGWRFFGHFAWWLWRTVYLSKVIGFRNKVKVMVDWTLNIFLPRDIGI